MYIEGQKFWAKILSVQFLLNRYICVNNTPIKINYILSTQKFPSCPFKINPLPHLKTTTSLRFIHILHLSLAYFLITEYSLYEYITVYQFY